MSAPANAAAASVTKLQTELKAARSELSGFQSQLSRANSLGNIAGHNHYSVVAQQARQKVYDLTQAAEAQGKAVDVAGFAFGPYVAGAKIAIGTVTALTGSLLALSYAAIRAANSEQTFQRNSRQILGGGKEGDEAFGLIETLSKRLPQSRRELVNWTNELQDAGITSVGVIRRGIQALSSAEALGPGGAAPLLNILRRVQESIQTTGKIKLADGKIAGLAKTGANVEDVAKELGISALILEQRLKAGTQDAGAFGNALLESINKKGRGPIKSMMSDLDSLATKGLDVFSRLFGNPDLTLQPLADSLQEVFSLLDQSEQSGKDLAKGITAGTNGIVKGFASIVDRVTITYLEVSTFALNADTALMPLEKTLGRIWKILSAIGGAAASGAASLIPGVDLARGIIRNGTSASAPSNAPGAVDQEAARLRSLAVTIASGRLAGSLKGEDLQAKADELGTALVAGMRQGIIDKQEFLTLQATALGQAAVDALNKPIQAHSPSRAGIRLGRFLGDGLALGMRGSAGAVDRAGVYLGERATRSSLYARPEAAAASAPAGSRSGGGVSIGHVDVNLSAPSGVTDAQDLSAWGLAIALERQLLMGGA